MVNLDKMKIAIVLRPNNQAPGLKYESCGRIVAPLIEGLMEKGHDITLYTAKPSTLNCNVIQSSGIINADNKNEVNVETHLWTSYIAQVIDNIRTVENKGDGYDIINNHDDPIFFAFGRCLKTPRITTVHASAVDVTRSLYSTYPNENLMAVSKAQKDSYPSNMNFRDVVYNGIDEDHPFSIKKCDYLFSVGRVNPFKGTRNAIEISKKTGLDLIIAGNVTDKKYFEEEIRPHLSRDLSNLDERKEKDELISDVSNYENNRGDIIYLGEITGQERDQLMKYAKAFLFPIEGKESFGLVLIEAGVTGTPVVAFNHSAIPEIIKQGKTGFYGGTLEELIVYTKRVGEIDPTKCREHVLENFGIERMVKGYIEAYRKIIERII